MIGFASHCLLRHTSFVPTATAFSEFALAQLVLVMTSFLDTMHNTQYAIPNTQSSHTTITTIRSKTSTLMPAALTKTLCKDQRTQTAAPEDTYF